MTMVLKVEHPLHRRRRARNVALGLALLVLMIVMFGLSVVKITSVGPIERFDHVLRPQMVEGAE